MHQYMRYSGSSMYPTLKEPDIMFVVPYNNDRSITIGDVIVFKPLHEQSFIVHRVVKLSAGIRTQGDNHSDLDIHIVQTNEIAGMVVSAQRGDKSRKISSGFNGRVWLISTKSIRFLLRIVYWLASFFIVRIMANRTSQSILKRMFKPKIIRLNRDEGNTEYIIWKKQTELCTL